MARTSINKDGVLVVHVENPEELHSILNQIFGEDDFPNGKNPTESAGSFPSGKFPDIWPEMPTKRLDDGDYPNAEDCTACNAKDCPIRKAPYGSTVPAPSLREAMERTYDRMAKDKALRDAMQKKARADAEDALAKKLYDKLSKHFYRDRAARYSRTAELLSQVNSLTEENRALKADLRAKGEAMDHYKRAVANPESISWNTSHDKATGAFIYVTGYEFDTLKALADGSAVVLPAAKKDVVVKPTHSPEPVWFHFIDPETGRLVVPMINAWVAVKTGFVTTQVMQRVEADHERAIRLNHRPGGISLWFNPKGDTFAPFDLAEAEWRYVAEPAPDMTGIPLNHMV